MTGHGPASMTVTGTWLPSSENTCVIPTFRPISPSLRAIVTPHLLQPEIVCSSSCISRPIKNAQMRGGEEARLRRMPHTPQGGPHEPTKQMGVFHRPLQLDFDVDAGWQIELHERVNGLRRGIHDVQQPL